MSPSCKIENEYTRLSNTTRIENDLRILTKTDKSRSYKNIETLDFVAEYIYDEFSKVCDTVYYQTFKVQGLEYKNVIGSIGIHKKEKMVIGAHYDVASN